jgi:DNA adenine methylase
VVIGVLEVRNNTGPVQKPFLNWAGSKRYVAKDLLQEKLPNFGNYHEPFLGSGAFFIALSSVYKYPRATLSDLNPHLTSMFCAIKNYPDSVIRALKLHELLDSEIHFAGVINDINSRAVEESPNPEHAADVIYILSQSFHSSWYETSSGRISISRRSNPTSFKAHIGRVRSASLQLANADIFPSDFRGSLARVLPNDLVFIDPPYLSENDQADARSYTAKRFDRRDLAELVKIVETLVSQGSHVIFCWRNLLQGTVFDTGSWMKTKKSNVWLSFRPVFESKCLTSITSFPPMPP